MKFARCFLIWCYGLFTISAQALLFREFLTAFEGSEFSVGVFFASWFFWIGLAAILAYRPFRVIRMLEKHIDLLFLLYIPAFILEMVLIVQARHIAGISSYTVWSLVQIVLMALIIGAPVSVITGLFFPLACRWMQQDSRLAVSSVYIFEAAGGFVGGIVTTLLLGAGVKSVTIFLLLAFIISLAVWFVRLAKRRFYTILLASVIPTGIIFCIGFGADKFINRYIQVVKWTQLLPTEALTGSFQTAQAEYLYGTYQGQWLVVREGSTCEVLPNKAATGRVAAISLSQKPDAKKVLIIGSGLGLCYDFLILPQIDKVTWTDCDPQYVQQVSRFLPEEFKISDPRLEYLAGDIRSQLTGRANTYDIVIINLPDAASSILNRYFTDEFYQQLKGSLTSGGIVSVRVTGGENIMGTELIDLGASVKYTLEKTFSHLILAPGDDTWFIASDSDSLTDAGRTLQRRFAGIKNAEAVFASSALSSVYQPQRAAAAMEAYGSSDLPANFLINKDARPLASLYSLLLAWKQSGSPVTKIVKLLALTGVTIFLVPIVVYVVLRLVYIVRTENQNRISSFDSSFLVFSAGWLGIGAAIVLMYLYQTRFGSLYLHIGVISSLFMIGLTAGAALIQFLLSKGQRKWPLFAAIVIHGLLLTAIAYFPADLRTQYHFAAAFLLCGLCTGAYFPIAAGQLAEGAFETGLSGGKLETADHIGAAAGSLVTGLVLLPVLGASGAVWVFIALIAANIPAALWKLFKGKSPSAAPLLELRRAGFILFGIAACVVIGSNLLVSAAEKHVPAMPTEDAQILAGEYQIEPAAAAVPGMDGKIPYFKVYDTDEILYGYIFYTRNFAPQVRGYGGKIDLAVYIDTTGELLTYRIIQSNETPSYFGRLANWHQKLVGRQLFDVRPFDGIRPVTGATVSSRAILSAIELSGKKFAQDILVRTSPGDAQKQPFLSVLRPDRGAVYLLIATAASIIVMYWGGFWSRLAVLVFNVIVGGVMLNIQFSTDQLTLLLSGQNFTPQLTGVFLLIAGLPLLIMLFGNIYCGYLCPFGAVQELIGFIIPNKWKLPLSYDAMRRARFIKYVVLFVLAMTFSISRSKSILLPDPLISVFSLQRSDISLENMAFVIILLILIGSVFYRRFWCRYLCPAGAFLSLFNNLILFKRLNTPKAFARCEFGLTAQDNKDCIYCDRCRQLPKSFVLKRQPGRLAAGLSRFILAPAAIVAIVVIAAYVDKFADTLPSTLRTSSIASSSSLPALSSAPLASEKQPEALSAVSSDTSSAPLRQSYGRPRDVDIRQIRTLIEQNKLSDQEARFYEKVD